MSTPTRTEGLSLAADRWAEREHQSDCVAWDRRDKQADRRVLLTWAEQWADLHAEFRAHGLTADQADAVLYDAMRVRTHPAARAPLVFLVAALCEAVDRLANLAGGLLDPLDVHAGPCTTLTRHEIAESLLRADIDEALRPMLDGGGQ